MLTLPSTSRSRRARIWREVRSRPSRPAIGEVLTPKVMRSVGSSTERRGSGRGSAGSVMVSPMVISGSPATATMSPGPASSTSTSSMPRAVVSEVTVPLSVTTRPGSTLPSGVSASSRRTVMRWPMRSRAVADAPDGHAPHVVVGGQVGDEQLERVAGHVARRRRVLHEQVHERLQVACRARSRSSVAVPRRASV